MTASARAIPTRRISFHSALEDIPEHFAMDGDLIMSHLTASLSAVFPDGEAFFVRSVRAFRDEIIDPGLKRQVAGYIGQETMHDREHRVFNDRLDQLGYPVRRYERFSSWLFETHERLAPAANSLALTAALEHVTATLAELVLSDERVQVLVGDPAVRDLFLWHTLEESEHKAVAFDVYKAACDDERLRVRTMNVVRYAFVIGMSTMVLMSMAGDRATYRRGNLRRSLRTFLGSPLMSRDLWRQLKDYNRPDFHPDDFDTEALTERWRTQLFGDNGTLNDKLRAQSQRPLTSDTDPQAVATVGHADP